MTRSVALVTAVYPSPRDSGKKVVLAGLLDYWVARVGADAVHLVLVDRDPGETDGLGVRVHRVGGPGALRQLRNVLTRTVPGRRSLQESALWDPAVGRRIDAVLSAVGADLVVYDTVRMAQYAPPDDDDGVQRVVYLDDLFSVRYERMLELMASGDDAAVDPMGDFGRHLPGPARRLVSHDRVTRALLRWERWLTDRSERAAASRFSTSLLISPEEVRRLSRSCPRARVRELPPTIDVALTPADPAAATGRPTFVLMGLLSLAHNLDAAEVFLRRCLPPLLEAMPDVRVHVVGRGAPGSLVELAARHPDHVSIDGFVPDLDDLLSGALALVMPLRFGSGIKIKVIEALGRGLPVVSTHVGAEGLSHGEAEGILVEDVPERYVDHLVRLRDPALRHRLSTAARDHYERRYSREAARTAYDHAFEPRPGEQHP